MRQTFHNKIFRKNYGKLNEILDISNLIEIQLNSYEYFLQKDVPAGERRNLSPRAHRWCLGLGKEEQQPAGEQGKQESVS